MQKLALFFGGMGVVVSAFSQTWVPATGGSWTNTANWTPATVPDSNTASVVVSQNFTNAPALPTLTLDRSAAFTVNKISYNDTAATYYGCTIAAGSPAGSLIFAGASPTVDTPGNAGAELTITAPVNVSQGLTKTGARYVYLNGVVTGFSSLTYNAVNGGMLVIGPATTIDWTAINKTAGSGTLRLDALSTMTAPAAYSVGAGEIQLNPAGGTFGFPAAGFTKNGAGTLRFTRDATGPGGSAVLTVAGGALCANANLSGFASGSVASGACLQPNAGVSYGNIPLTITGTGTSGAQGALFFNSTQSATVTWPGAITVGGAGASIGSYGVTYNTTLSGSIGGTGALTINGRGGSSTSHTATFTLSSACTYTGNTTFQNNDGLMNATLKLGVNDTLPTGTVLTLNIANNAAATGVTFDLNGKSQRLAGLAKNATGASTKYRVINSSATASTLTISNAVAVAFDGLIGIANNTNFSLVKQGNATLTLSGASAYSGGTTVSGGTLLVNTSTGCGTGNVTVNGGAALGGNGTIPGNVTVNSNGTASVSGSIQGSVTVNGGATLSNSGTIQGAVTVAAGATLLPGGSGAVGTLTLQKTLTLNGDALFFDMPASGANDTIALTGAGAAGEFVLNGTNTVTLNFLDGTLPAGTYTLMTYASQSGDGTLVLDPVCRNATLSVGSTSVTLTITGSGTGLNLTWVGGSGNPWDINGSTVWDNGSAADVFFNLDSVLFSDSGSASPAVDITTAVQPSAVVVSNVVNAYTFSGTGAIAGASTLTKLGTNTLTLANVNTYSGATTVKAGRLAYGINDAIGAGAVSITNATVVLGAYTDTVGTVTVQSGGQLTGTSGSLATTGTLELKGGTVSATIAGSGAVNASLQNASTLSGANTYTGPTTVGVNGVSNTLLYVGHPLALGSTVSGTTVNGGAALTLNRVMLNSGIAVTNETLTLDSGPVGYRAGLGYSPGSGSATWAGNVVIAGTAGAYLACDTVGGSLVVGNSSDDTITGAAGHLSLRGNGTVIVNSRVNIGATPINRDDAGTFLVNSTSNVWGASNINQGTLKLGVSDALPANTMLSIGKGGGIAAAALDLNGNSQTIAGLAEQHNTIGTQKILSAAPATLIVNNTNVSTFGTTNSVIEGAVSLVKANSGTLVLIGTNTNSGAYIVSNGTLIVSASGSFGINSTNVVVASGTLTLSNSVAIADAALVRIANGGGAKVNLPAGVNETVGLLYFGDRQKGGGTYGATGSGAGVINDEHFSGLGVLTVLHGNVGTLFSLQ